MKSTIKDNKPILTKVFQKGSLYNSTNNNDTVVLCTETSGNSMFKGVCVHCTVVSYIGAYTEWYSKSFERFSGEIILEQ